MRYIDLCKSAALAQLVEHRIRNAGVGCSNHPGGTIYFIGVSRGLRYYVKV